MKRGGTNSIATELTDGSLSYVRAVSSTTLKFYASAANASSDTSPYNLTAAGSDETHYIYKCTSAIDVTATSTPAASFTFTCPTATTVANNVLVYRYVATDGLASGATNYPNEMFITSLDTGVTGGPGCAAAWTVTAAGGGSTGTLNFHSFASFATMAWTFGIKPASGAPVPAYVDPAGSNGLIINPLHLFNSNTGFTNTMEDMTTVATTITSFGGRSITSDALANANDFGLNPFANAMSGTPGVSANWQGYRLDTGSGSDFSTGALLGTFRNANPRDHSFDQGKLEESNLPFGVGIILQDTSGNWRGWQIAALDAIPSTLGRYVFGVDADNTSTDTETSGAFDSTAVRKYGLLYSAPRTATVNYWSFLVKTQTLKMVGGSSSLPANIVDLDTVGNHFLFPLTQLQGSSSLLSLTPIQLGGSVASYIELNATSIQFPRVASTTAKQVFWHGVADGTNNTLSLSYKLLAGDTVKHTNSIVSSPSKYTWQVDSASSASATYDFTGLTIIGADPVTLRDVATFSQMSFSDCGLITTNSAPLADSTIANSTATSGAIIFSSVAVGDDVDRITFTNNNDGDIGHSIRITATGTYTFDGHTFSGGGPAERTFLTNSSGVDDGNDYINTDAAHGYVDGDAVYYQDQGGSQTVGLTDGQLYYVNAIDTDTLSFHTTKANAIAGTPKVALAPAGAETHHLYSAKADVFVDVSGSSTISVTNGGDTPTIRERDGASVTVQNTVTLEVNGLTAGARVSIIANETTAAHNLGDVITNGEASASGVFTYSYNYQVDQGVNVVCRLVGFLPFQTTATIVQPGGITVTAVWQVDTISDRVDTSGFG